MEETIVRIKKTHKSIEDVFPVGSIATIRRNVYTERTLKAKAIIGWNKEKQEDYVYKEAVYAEPGDFKNHTIFNFEGKEYDGDIFSRCLGPNNGSWANVFEKITE